MNTDPWVFGDRMIYSNCRQTIAGAHGELRPTLMQRLARGSVICFGSTIGRAFCLDTVFVVASAETWAPRTAAHLGIDDAFRVCTVEATATAKRQLLSLTLYRGATLDDPIDGMFSFVPARLASERDPRFARPRVSLPGFINPSNVRSTLGSKRPLPFEVVRANWMVVRRQVLDAGVRLATWLQTPECRKTDGGVMGAMVVTAETNVVDDAERAGHDR